MSVSVFPSQVSKPRIDSRTQAFSVEGTAEAVQKCCLAVILVGVPLTTAWAKEGGLVVFLVASVILTLAGVIRGWSSKHNYYLLTLPVCVVGASCLLIAMQLVSLPESMLKFLSPVQQNLFADWGKLHLASVTPDRWNTISLTPHLTESCLALAMSYFQFTVGVTLFLKSTGSVSWLVRTIAISAVTMAVIGIAQLLSGTEKFLWLFENPMRSAKWPAKGTFTNQNHFAGFLSLGLGPCLMQIFGVQINGRGRQKNRAAFSGSDSVGLPSALVQKFWVAASAVILLAGVLTFSRGGLAALCVAALVCGFTFRDRLVSFSKFLLPAITFCILGLIAFGAEAFSSKWNLLVTSSSLEDVSSGRAALWQSLIDAAPSFAFWGAGAGSHAEVYPVWMQQDFAVRFSHAENGYLQLLIEMGLPGIILLCLALFALLRGVITAYRRGADNARLTIGVCSAGVIAGLVHSFADFVWYMPGYLIVNLTLVILLFQLSSPVTKQASDTADQPSVGQRSFHPWMALLTILPLCYWGGPRAIADANSEGYWLSYRGGAIATDRVKLGNGLVGEEVDSMISALESCLEKDPADCRAMSELAVMYLRRFEMNQVESDNPMSLSEIRSTVRSVNFDSKREMLQWMVKAFGDGVGDLFRSVILSRRSIVGQPLRASPYLVLHQLGFMISSDEGFGEDLINQALAVRPHDAGVHYAAGISDIESGNLDLGYDRLAFAFRKDVGLRKLILSQLVELLTVQEAVGILRPESDAMIPVFEAYREVSEQSDVVWAAERFRADFVEADHPQRSTYWYSAASIFEYLGDHEAEIEALKKALLLSPQAYSGHRRVALRISEIGQYGEAVSALKRCLIRNPSDEDVKQRLTELQHNSAGLTN